MSPLQGFEDIVLAPSAFGNEWQTPLVTRFRKGLPFFVLRDGIVPLPKLTAAVYFLQLAFYD
jgi:hypothetical protein